MANKPVLNDFARLCADRRIRFGAAESYNDGNAYKVAVFFKTDFLFNIYLNADYSNIVEQLVKLFEKHPTRNFPYFKLRKNTLNVKKTCFTLAVLRNSYDVDTSRDKLTRCSDALGTALLRASELKSVHSEREACITYSAFVDYYELHRWRADDE